MGDVNTALDRLEATVTEYQDVISLPDVDRAREYAATVRNELQQRMTKESGRALIEDAQRWQRAYEKARDDLAAAEAEREQALKDGSDYLAHLHAAEARVRALQDGLRDLYDPASILADPTHQITQLEWNGVLSRLRAAVGEVEARALLADSEATDRTVLDFDHGEVRREPFDTSGTVGTVGSTPPRDSEATT